jgi:glucosamine-6-phosphate deaminase
MVQRLNEFVKDKLKVQVYQTESDLGQAAADFTASRLQSVLSEKGSANLILATGASQFSFLEALISKDVDWKKITVFHLDEYIGISDQHPASFRRYLKERILDIVSPGKVYLINGDAQNLEEEMMIYENLLKTHPVDFACIGIGENGHIAFNDPPVADFNDPLWVKDVELDEACRKQQMGEGWFPTMDDVPRKAVTLTVTAILNCRTISCVVPGERKAKAVHDTLNAEISEACPATILRNHPDTTLFLDVLSAPRD